jgi:hypothetical protein
VNRESARRPATPSTRLPPALRGWEDELSMFPPDVVHTLLPWLPRLAATFGPLKRSTREGDGTPDGFGGLTRRGSYERLLLSEWAIAEEAPLEFLRRAAMTEHTFLELQRRAPSASLHSIALFDAGPHQIGAPRLVHLATLVVLARRARLAGVAFRWGVLQDPERRTFEHLDAQSVLNLLQGRSTHEGKPEDVDAFLERLDPGDDGLDDLWFVGGNRTAKLARLGQTVEVVESMEIGDRALDVRLAPKDPVRFELPHPNVCVRLLRDPFEVRKPAPVRVAMATTGGGVAIADGGRRLFLRTQAGVLALGLPHKPLEHHAEPRHLGAQRGPIVAVGWWHKRYWVLSVDGLQPVLSVRNKRGQLIDQLELERGETTLMPPGADAPIAGMFHVHGYCFVQLESDVFAIDLQLRSIERIATDVLGAARRAGRLWTLRGRDATKSRLQPWSRTRQPDWYLPFPTGEVFFCRNHAIVVMRQGDAFHPIGSANRWEANWFHRRTTSDWGPITVPSAEEAIGAFAVGGRQIEARVIAANAERTRVLVYGAHMPPYELWTEEVPFVGAAYFRNLVVLHLANDQIVVIDAQRARIIRSYSAARVGA